MATQARIPSGAHFDGLLSATSFSVQGGVSNSDVAAAAGIEATKLVHQFPIPNQLFGSTVAISATIREIYLAKEAGTVSRIESIMQTASTSTDRIVNVALHKSSAGSTYATILSANSIITSTSTPRVPEEGTISSAAYVDGDSFRLVVSVAGSSGTQATGLLVNVWFRENPGA